MAFSGSGAAQGAVGGASAGAAFGPWGAAIGGVGGGIAGGFLGGPGKKSGYNRSDIERLTNARHQQIQDFSNQLMQARQRYLTNLNNFQNLAFKRFAPIAESQYAGRGLNVTGGAFQSELAKQAAQAQAEGALQASQMERQDLGNVENAFGGLYSGQMGLMGQQPEQVAPNAFSQFAGQAAGLGLEALLKQRMLAGTGGATPTPSSGNVFGGSGMPSPTRRLDFNQYNTTGFYPRG